MFGQPCLSLSSLLTYAISAKISQTVSNVCGQLLSGADIYHIQINKHAVCVTYSKFHDPLSKTELI